MEDKRDSFVFYRSFYEAISILKKPAQADIYNAIVEFALNGTEPNLSQQASIIFTLIKPQITANNKRYRNGKKGAEFGARGGRPKKEKPQENPIGVSQDNPIGVSENNPTGVYDENPKKTPNENVNVNVNENVNVNDKDTLSGKPDRAPDNSVHKEIIKYLNQRTGKSYKASNDKTQRLIDARINAGFALADFYTVIDTKTKQWQGTDMEKYLRPETLFGTKFEGYLQEGSNGDNGDDGEKPVLGGEDGFWYGEKV